MPIKPLIAIFGTIQKINHYIRTTFRDSTQYINRLEEEKLNQGILQGNGVGPIAWIVTNIPQINILNKAEHVVLTVSMIKKKKDCFLSFLFVDDTDLLQGNLVMDRNEIEDMAEAMKDTIDL